MAHVTRMSRLDLRLGREVPGDGLGAVGGAELAEDASHVRLHGVGREIERFRDRARGCGPGASPVPCQHPGHDSGMKERAGSREHVHHPVEREQHLGIDCRAPVDACRVPIEESGSERALALGRGVLKVFSGRQLPGIANDPGGAAVKSS